MDISAVWRVCNFKGGTLGNAERSILIGDESGGIIEMLNASLFGEGGLKDAVTWSQNMTEQVLDPAIVSLSCAAEVGPDDGLQLTTNTASHGKSAKQRGYRRHGAKWGARSRSKANKEHHGGSPLVKSQRAGAR